jgi:hypothetical protein
MLTGAGCANTSTTQPINAKPAEQASTTTAEAPIIEIATSTVAEATTTPSTDMTLTAKAIGNGMVQFNWTFPEGVSNPRTFHLVRGQNENPTQPPGNWYKVDGKSRSTIWVKLGKGNQHFRICTWEINKCGSYSNDVLVDVE